MNSRVNHLKRAFSNCKSVKQVKNPDDVVLELEISETLEIAEVQVELEMTVRNSPELGNLLTEINAKLLSITEVYIRILNIIVDVSFIFKGV